MDGKEIKLNSIWSNRFTSSQRQSTLFDGSTDLIQSRFFTILIATLVFIVSINLILSLWIIHSLQIANGGLGDGNLLTTIKRMTVKGPAKFDGWLTAEEINPVHRDQWLTVVGSADQIQLTDSLSDQTTSLTINHDAINYQGPNLIVNKLVNGSRQIQFSINSNQLTTSSLKQLKSTDWGLAIGESLQTTSIKGDHYHDLRLESKMKGLNMESRAESVTLKSRVGQIEVTSLKDLTLSATRSMKIESSRIQLSSLVKSTHGRHHHHYPHSDGNHTSHRKEMIAYQVCTCENGRLFLTYGDKSCYLLPKVCSVEVESGENTKTK